MLPKLIALPLLLAALPAQTASYSTFGAGCQGTGTGLGALHVAPQAYAAAFMPSNNVIGLSGAPQRYQQVFLAGELPAPFVMAGLALRWDDQTVMNLPHILVDLEIHVGYTTRTPTTISTTFAANFDLAAPVTVLPRTTVDYPEVPAGPHPDPTAFQLVIPWTTTFSWAPPAGANLLVEVIQRAATGTQVFDCGWSPAIARVYGAPTAAVGTTDGFAYGYAMGFVALTSTAVPTLTGADTPQFGNRLPIDLQQGAPSAFAVLLTGVSRTTWGPTPLPLDLAVYGAPGCALQTSIEWSQFRFTDAQGRARCFVDVPLDLSLGGLSFYNQFAVYDPTANAMGYVVTNAGTGVIGL